MAELLSFAPERVLRTQDVNLCDTSTAQPQLHEDEVSSYTLLPRSTNLQRNGTEQPFKCAWCFRNLCHQQLLAHLDAYMN